MYLKSLKKFKFSHRNEICIILLFLFKNALKILKETYFTQQALVR